MLHDVPRGSLTAAGAVTGKNEFWASDDANSGIFFRCFEPPKISDRLCYEANI